MENAYPSEDGEALSSIGNSISGTTQAVDPEHAISQSAIPNWFAVYTTPRHEKRIAKYFSMREVEHFLPLYQLQRRWKDGSKVSLELPLFPSYIFVRIARVDRIQVLEVPGVLAIVGSGREPAPISGFEIESLRSGLRTRKIQPHPLLVVGDRARIKSGAMAGMEGVVVRKNNGLRVVLTLDLIMQSIAIEIDENELEPIGTAIQKIAAN